MKLKLNTVFTALLMRLKLAIFAVTASLAMAAPVQAETWSCAYEGSWSTFANSETGEFKWNVTWHSQAGDSWKVAGQFTDHYGPSKLEGRCDRSTCALTQKYQKGELAGKTYFWKGRYTDEPADNARTINRFEGAWGETNSAKDGAWKAIAICKSI